MAKTPPRGARKAGSTPLPCRRPPVPIARSQGTSVPAPSARLGGADTTHPVGAEHWQTHVPTAAELEAAKKAWREGGRAQGKDETSPFAFPAPPMHPLSAPKHGGGICHGCRSESWGPNKAPIGTKKGWGQEAGAALASPRLVATAAGGEGGGKGLQVRQQRP